MPVIIKKLKPVEVDAIAFRYIGLKQTIEEESQQLDNIKDEIKKRADKEGIRNGKTKLIYGERYEVGFTEPDAAPIFDESLALKFLGKTRVDKFRTILDVEALMKSLNDDELRKVIIKAGKQTPRVVVRKRKDAK